MFILPHRKIIHAISSNEFNPNHMMLHSYPLPVAEDESSLEWLFVADALNFSFWALEENAHYCVELRGVQYTGYMALCAAITKALEVLNVNRYASKQSHHISSVWSNNIGWCTHHIF